MLVTNISVLKIEISAVQEIRPHKRGELCKPEQSYVYHSCLFASLRHLLSLTASATASVLLRPGWKRPIIPRKLLPLVSLSIGKPHSPVQFNEGDIIIDSFFLMKEVMQTNFITVVYLFGTFSLLFKLWQSGTNVGNHQNIDQCHNHWMQQCPN